MTMSEKSSEGQPGGDRVNAGSQANSLSRWIDNHRNTPEVENFHYCLEFGMTFNTSSPLKDLIGPPYAQDKPALWAHARHQLLHALVPGMELNGLFLSVEACRMGVAASLTQYTERTRVQLARHFYAYYRSLEFGYLQWRLASLEREVADYIASAPVFVLPELRGGSNLEDAAPGTEEKTTKVLCAHQFYQDVWVVLKRRLRPRYSNPYAHERTIKHIIGKLFDGGEPVPADRQDQWIHLPTRKLAVAIAAWAYKMKPSYLEWSLPKANHQHFLLFFTTLRRFLSRLYPVDGAIERELAAILATIFPLGVTRPIRWHMPPPSSRLSPPWADRIYNTVALAYVQKLEGALKSFMRIYFGVSESVYVREIWGGVFGVSESEYIEVFGTPLGDKRLKLSQG